MAEDLQQAEDRPTTLQVRGEGGAVWTMDVPQSGHARELFEQQITRGQLAVLNDDGLPLQPAAAIERFNPPATEEPATPENTDEVTVDGKVRDETAPIPRADENPAGDAGDAPDKLASKAAWADYAESKGVDHAGMNKAEIIHAVEALAAEHLDPS